MFNPNYLSRSERRHNARIRVLPTINESRPAYVPTPPAPPSVSLADMMIFDMDALHPKTPPNLTTSPVLDPLQAPSSQSERRQTGVADFLFKRASRQSPRTDCRGNKPQRRVVGFSISDSPRSSSECERSSSCESEMSMFDLGD